MRYLLPFLCLFASSTGSLAQQAKPGEFILSENGLIYGDSTIRQLKHIVDSLNLKFKVCELNRTFQAVPQTIGHYISIEGKLASIMRKDLESQISFESLVKKYPKLTYEKDLLIIAEPQEWTDVKVVYNSLSFTGQYRDGILGPPATVRQPLRKRAMDLFLLGGVGKSQSFPDSLLFRYGISCSFNTGKIHPTDPICRLHGRYEYIHHFPRGQR